MHSGGTATAHGMVGDKIVLHSVLNLPPISLNELPLVEYCDRRSFSLSILCTPCIHCTLIYPPGREACCWSSVVISKITQVLILILPPPKGFSYVGASGSAGNKLKRLPGDIGFLTWERQSLAHVTLYNLMKFTREILNTMHCVLSKHAYTSPWAAQAYISPSVKLSWWYNHAKGARAISCKVRVGNKGFVEAREHMFSWGKG